MTVVEGLTEGRTALVAKMHHALVDGLAAVDVSTVILDPTPEGLEIEPPAPRAGPERRRNARLEGLTRLAGAQRSAHVQPGGLEPQQTFYLDGVPYTRSSRPCR